MTKTTPSPTTQNPVKNTGGIPTGVSAEDLAKAGWAKNVLSFTQKKSLLNTLKRLFRMTSWGALLRRGVRSANFLQTF